MHSIEYDSTTGTMYGSSWGDIYRIDTTTGAATLIGSGNGLQSHVSLCFDPSTGTMYAAGTGIGILQTVDLVTGTLTPIGPLVNSVWPSEFAFDGDTGTIWMLDNRHDALLTVDPATGYATVVGHHFGQNMLGMMYVSGPGAIARNATGCGTANVAAFGVPQVGHSVDVDMTDVTGIPFLGLGLAIGNTSICSACSFGH
ncbi:MAG: hypothetical protein KDC98_13105, partial [Planctomycetes bacterium]|nr:hypothetical protein [Planctomycetota bacterium]